MVWVVLRYWLKLRTIVGIYVWALVRVCARYCVAWVDVIESHISMLLFRVCDRSIHSFYWKLRAELTTGWWSLRWTFHQIALLVLNHLVPWSFSWYRRRLHSSNTVTPLHHLVEYFLLHWICICLVFFTDWRTTISWVVSNAKKVCPCIVAAVWFGLELVAIGCRHVSTGFSVWLHGSHLLHIETWWLSRLSWNRVVLEGVLSHVSTTMTLLGLVSNVIV